MKKLRAVAVTALSIAGAVAASASVVSCSGGGAEGGCPALTDVCGGNLVGFWQVTNKCDFLPTQPSQPLLYAQYVAKPPDPVLTPVQPLGTTGGDWCAGLFYPAPSGGSANTGIQNVTLWHGPAALHSGTASFSTAGGSQTYQTSLVFQAPSMTHFTPPCLEMSGFSPTCAQLQSDLVKFYAATAGQKFVNPVGSSGQPIPGDPIQCAPASDHGCDCSSTFEVDLVDQGTWAAAGGVVSENSENYTYNGKGVSEYQPAVATSANYCARGGHLTLTGVGGASLSGVLGLRTIILTAAQSPDGGP